ncbi:MAG: NAD-dependent epimerase/dehydratase family protein [Vicinamibacterales bacterium]
MKVLVLGGTRFVGRHIVDALVERGDLVTVFTRGQSPDPLPAGVLRVHGDRNNGAAGLDPLVGHSWDAVVDVSGYTPRQVRPSAELFWGKVDRYVFVSTVSVYVDSPNQPVLETHPLLPEAAEDVIEITPDTYGSLKVTCERIVTELYGARATILRPQIIAGPWDPTGRHTYWVQRAMQGGEMLGPGPGDDFVQVVDARDIARFTRHVVDAGIGGIFNMAGPRATWAGFLDAAGAADVVWVANDLLEAAGLTFAEVPLFRPNGASFSSVMHVSHERASQAGFQTTSMEQTIADTRAWLRDHPFSPALKPDVERDLIAQARRRASAATDTTDR